MRPRRLGSVEALALLAAACWRLGEPTSGPAVVTWAAYPETVVVGQVFSLEFAGPISPTTCGRLDTAIVAVKDSTIELSAVRDVFQATCSHTRVSFYEARPLRLERAGTYAIRGTAERPLGSVVALDSGRFSAMSAVGEGTVTTAGGCTLFAPGWVGNQRPFALRGVPRQLAGLAAGDRIVFVRGRLAGYVQCGSFGSRPVIRVDTAWTTGASVSDYYP